MRPARRLGGSPGPRRRLRAGLVQLLCALAGLVLVLLFLVVQWAFTGLPPWLTTFRDDPIE